MDAKRLLIGTVVGAVVLFAVGFLFWGLLFVGFFEAQQTAVVSREAPIYWAGILSSLLFGAFLTLALDWTGSSSVTAGLKIGALVGLLVWGSVDLILYGNFDFATLTGVSADIVLETIHNALAGAAIAAVIGGGAAAAAASEPEAAAPA